MGIWKRFDLSLEGCVQFGQDEMCRERFFQQEGLIQASAGDIWDRGSSLGGGLCQCSVGHKATSSGLRVVLMCPESALRPGIPRICQDGQGVTDSYSLV